MRADAATLGRPGDHQVVQARLRHEAEARQHFLRCRHMQIQPLHQHRPVALLQRRQAAPAQRTAHQRPVGIVALAMAHHQARLDLVALGQAEQLGAADRRLHARQRLTHQQRLTLPVSAHEVGRAQAAEQRDGLVDRSDRGIGMAGGGNRIRVHPRIVPVRDERTP